MPSNSEGGGAVDPSPAKKAPAKKAPAKKAPARKGPAKKGPAKKAPAKKAPANVQVRSAAIFDLDRTLLAGASGPVIAEALRGEGLVPGRPSPLEAGLFKFYDLFGETWPSMFLSRQGARVARGWEQRRAQAAAERAAAPLCELVQPYARLLIQQHREAGRILVLATTSPIDMVTPMAKRLGFDHVIASRFEVDKGRYTGNFDGDFVWGRAKAAAVSGWAAAHGVTLSESFAYSDSYYDVPLLSLVGQPVAVNPDPRLSVIAASRHWPVTHFDVPPSVPKLGSLVEPQRLIQPLARPELFPYARFRMSGLRHLPRTGPAIVVANHRSYFDPLVMGVLLARVGRPVRFLGKKEVFDAPVVGPIARAMGGIRVDRGTGSGQPLHEAEQALAAGEVVALMPQGTIPRGAAFYDTLLQGRWGAAQLAQASRAPVIPVGLWGTEEVWPRSSRLPAVWNVLRPPTVQLRVGPPVSLDYADLDADTRSIMDAISRLLPAEARRARTPTEEEIRRALPPGMDDVPEAHEKARRPGRD